MNVIDGGIRIPSVPPAQIDPVATNAKLPLVDLALPGLRQLSSHLQAAREEERARMSREIHDELGGTLTGLKMDVSRLSKSADTLTPAQLAYRESWRIGS